MLSWVRGADRSRHWTENTPLSSSVQNASKRASPFPTKRLTGSSDGVFAQFKTAGSEKWARAVRINGAQATDWACECGIVVQP